jgi:hypothetical protein
LEAAQREIDAEFDRLSREESQRAVDQAEQPGAWPTEELPVDTVPKPGPGYDEFGPLEETKK